MAQTRTGATILSMMRFSSKTMFVGSVAHAILKLRFHRKGLSKTQQRDRFSEPPLSIAYA